MARKNNISLPAGRAGKFLAVLTAVVAVFSCSEPVKQYSFKDFTRGDGWSKDVPAELSLDIRDGVNDGKFYICAQIVCNAALNGFSEIPLSVDFTAPDGKRYYDNIDLPLNVIRKEGVVQHNGRLMQIQWPYMRLSDTYISGRWSITLRHRGDHPVYRNILGIGASYRAD